MGVDGIGKGGLPPVGPEGAGQAEVAEEAKITEGSAPEAPELGGSEALSRLERGEIDRAGYLDARVEVAMAHLEGRLPAEQLDAVRRALREQLETDPALTELVRRVVGAGPPVRG